MDPTWFRGFVKDCEQRRSLPSVQAWVTAHEPLMECSAMNDVRTKSAAKPAHPKAGSAPRVHYLAAHPEAGSAPRMQSSAPAGSAGVQYSDRNDVRTSAGTSAGIDIGFPPDSSSTNDYNIFADITLHDQAAATIASTSQRRSGFSASMSMADGEAQTRFKAYLSDFIAPHWHMSYYKEQEVRHSTTNHSQFVDDLISIVVEGLSAVGGDAEAAKKVEESVRKLSQRLSSNKSVEEKLTLFSSFWMGRPNSTGPIIYGIFYTQVKARYEQNFKTDVISTHTNTYSVIFSLNSGVLIANEQEYNALVKSSVKDWLNSHDI